MANGLWVLAWLCLQPYCTKPLILPLDTFNNDATCILLAHELEKQYPDDTFVCTQEREL